MLVGAGLGHYQGFKTGFSDGRSFERNKRAAIDEWKKKRLDKLSHNEHN